MTKVSLIVSEQHFAKLNSGIDFHTVKLELRKKFYDSEAYRKALNRRFFHTRHLLSGRESRINDFRLSPVSWGELSKGGSVMQRQTFPPSIFQVAIFHL